MPETIINGLQKGGNKMKIELKKIDRSNYLDCIKLRLGKDQEKFVASNLFSLVEAAYEPDLYPLGVYCDDKMVGFFLYDYDEELHAWSMSRFMIDKKYQHQGIGRKALKSFLEFFRAQYGDIDLYTSAEVENPIAIALYEAFGFQKKEIFEYDSDGNHYREFRMIRTAIE